MRAPIQPRSKIGTNNAFQWNFPLIMNGSPKVANLVRRFAYSDPQQGPDPLV
jgi:hypothetical protein